jgi:hypothetical protein
MPSHASSELAPLKSTLDAMTVIAIGPSLEKLDSACLAIKYQPYQFVRETLELVKGHMLELRYPATLKIK